MNYKGYLLKSVLVLVQLLAVAYLHARPADNDTLQVTEVLPQELPKEVHSPRKASIYSAILPGLGQAYNKKYWKIPFVYIGFGTIGYFITWNNDNYQLFRTAYIHLTDGNPETDDYMKIEAVRRNYTDLSNPHQFSNLRTALSRQQDYYRRNRDLLVISFIGFYGLNIIDASVDAHFFDFDISDDLTLNWQPSVINFNNNSIFCINVSFNF